MPVEDGAEGCVRCDVSLVEKATDSWTGQNVNFGVPASVWQIRPGGDWTKSVSAGAYSAPDTIVGGINLDSGTAYLWINPDDADAHYNLGIAYFSLNDIDSALAPYTNLRSLDSERANNLLEYMFLASLMFFIPNTACTVK